MVASHPFRRSGHCLGTFVAVRGVAVLASGFAVTQASGQLSAASGVPTFDVVPHWPAPLPNHWALGPVSGIGIAARKHIILTQRNEFDPTMAAGCEAAAPGRIQKFRQA